MNQSRKYEAFDLDFEPRVVETAGGGKRSSYRHLLFSESPTAIANEILGLNWYYSDDKARNNRITQRILALNFAMKEVGGNLAEEVERNLPDELKSGPIVVNQQYKQTMKERRVFDV